MHTHWHQLGRQLRLTAIENPYSLSLVLRDPALRLQPGETGLMRITIDGVPFSGTFTSDDPAVAVVQLAAESAVARRFFNAFRYGNVMAIGMPSGYGFETGLRGSNAASVAMNECIDRTFPRGGPARAGRQPRLLGAHHLGQAGWRAPILWRGAGQADRRRDRQAQLVIPQAGRRAGQSAMLHCSKALDPTVTGA